MYNTWHEEISTKRTTNFLGETREQQTSCYYLYNESWCCFIHVIEHCFYNLNSEANEESKAGTNSFFMKGIVRMQYLPK